MNKSIFFIPFLLSIILAFSYQNSNKITVAVAANMKPAMDSIWKLYKIENPNQKVDLIYGSSVKFYEQILNNAPFDVFFSADINYLNKLKNNKLAISKVKSFAIGKLAIWSKKINPNINKMSTLIDPTIKKIAIANPITAPYGKKSIESLKFYNLYKKIKMNLVYGENIAQTAQFLVFGVADIGIIALSDCLSSNMKKEKGYFWAIPIESYKPLIQGCIVLKQAKNKPNATKFYEFISSKKAKAILTHFGYSIPK